MRLRCSGVNFRLFARLKGLVWQIFFVLVTGRDRFPQKRIKRPWFCTDCRAESHACTSSATIFSRSLCILTCYTVLDKH